MKQRCFVEQAPDATLYFQIIDLGRQLYVWASVGPGAKLKHLCMAIQAPAVGNACWKQQCASAHTHTHTHTTHTHTHTHAHTHTHTHTRTLARTHARTHALVFHVLLVRVQWHECTLVQEQTGTRSVTALRIKPLLCE